MACAEGMSTRIDAWAALYVTFLISGYSIRHRNEVMRKPAPHAHTTRAKISVSRRLPS
jgi:hypothetical protein